MSGDSAEEVAKLQREVEALKGTIRSLRTGMDGFNQSTAAAVEGVSKLFALGSRTNLMAGEVGKQSTALADMKLAAVSTKDAIADLTAKAGDLIGAIPGIGTMASPIMNALDISLEGISSLAGVAVDTIKIAAEALDGPSRDMRLFDNEVYNVGRRFGQAHDQAVEFADALKMETASSFARSMHMTRDEMADFIRNTQTTSLTLDQLNETVDTGVGVTKLYAMASAQATAMNISSGQAANLLNIAMNKQGLSAQSAGEMLGSFSAIAGETGLNVTSVSQTLNGAVQNFQKLGFAADFGRPILEGFGRVMDDMGLGIEEATGLTQTLTGALAGLTNNYANAYIMFQRGGLEIAGGGSGTVLGSSIALQSAVLQAERTGDQSELGAQLVTGLRDTLASFTGGEIVTVEQAAASPELETQFFMQQQLLKSQFGISDQAQATRVLDLLADIDSASRTGDSNTREELQKQLANELDSRDKTLGEWDKANRQLEIQSNLLAVIARPGVMQLREMAAEGREFLTPAIEGVGADARSGLSSILDRFNIEPTSAAAQILAADAAPNDPLAGLRASNLRTPGTIDQAQRNAQQIDQLVNQVAADRARNATVDELGGKTRAEYELLQRGVVQNELATNGNINVTIKLQDGVGGSILELVGAEQRLANGGGR